LSKEHNVSNKTSQIQKCLAILSFVKWVGRKWEKNTFYKENVNGKFVTVLIMKTYRGRGRKA